MGIAFPYTVHSGKMPKMPQLRPNKAEKIKTNKVISTEFSLYTRLDTLFIEGSR